MILDPEEATRLCSVVTTLHKAAERIVQHDWDWDDLHAIADALESGDLRIVSAARLAALEKVAEWARIEQHGCGGQHLGMEPCYGCHAMGEAAPDMIQQALAELDALDGGDAK